MSQTPQYSSGPTRGGPQETFVEATHHFGVPPPPLPPRDTLHWQSGQNGQPNPHNPGRPPDRPPDPNQGPNPSEPWVTPTSPPWRSYTERTPLKLTLYV